MLELVSFFRPFGTWQFLLAVCLLDLALICVHLAQREDLHSDAQVERVRRMLDEELAVSQRLQREVRLMEAADQERAKMLRTLSQGLSSLESQIERLKGLRNEKFSEPSADSHSSELV